MSADRVDVRCHRIKDAGGSLVRLTGRRARSIKGRRVLAVAVGAGTVAAFTVVAAAAGTANAQPLPAGCTQSGQTVTCSYTYTGGEQTFTVPSGVTTLDVTAAGAAGGTDSVGDSGGAGASVEDTAVPVSAYQGQALTVVVGGVGGTGTETNGGAGGSPGGGGAGGDYPNGNPNADGDGAGGGGYSGLLSPSGSALVIAGGGGGGALGNNGGAGDTGNGGGAAGCLISGCGGGGGTSTAGGAGGSGLLDGGGNGSPGASLAGGQGGTSNEAYNSSGGGGGGGYYGGGGGDGGNDKDVGAGGGGGGSSFGVTGLTDEVAATGPASVTISYTVPVTTTTTTVASSANPSVPGQAVTYTATVNPSDGGGTVSFSGGGTPITGCTAQTLNSSGQATCQVTYTAPGSHQITATYTGDAAYQGSTTATALTQTVVPDKADLKVGLSATAKAADGASVTETVTVTNQGPAPASKIITALTEPSVLILTSAGGAKVTGPVLTWTTASLAPGASVTFTVTAQAGAHARGTVLVAAGALSATPDPDLLNNAAVAKILLG